jgi:hypothetical protein
MSPQEIEARRYLRKEEIEKRIKDTAEKRANEAPQQVIDGAPRLPDGIQ